MEAKKSAVLQIPVKQLFFAIRKQGFIQCYQDGSFDYFQHHSTHRIISVRRDSLSFTLQEAENIFIESGSLTYEDTKAIISAAFSTAQALQFICERRKLLFATYNPFTDQIE